VEGEGGVGGKGGGEGGGEGGVEGGGDEKEGKRADGESCIFLSTLLYLQRNSLVTWA
jgi:hypothetical protein